MKKFFLLLYLIIFNSCSSFSNEKLLAQSLNELNDRVIYINESITRGEAEIVYE